MFNIFPDVDECKTNPCGKHAICRDSIGSYVCVCEENYTGDPIRGCVDIDECESLEKPCGADAICRNSVPGYDCECPQGYQPNPTAQVACEQVNIYYPYKRQTIINSAIDSNMNINALS